MKEHFKHIWQSQFSQKLKETYLKASEGDEIFESYFSYKTAKNAAIEKLGDNADIKDYDDFFDFIEGFLNKMVEDLQTERKRFKNLISEIESNPEKYTHVSTFGELFGLSPDVIMGYADPKKGKLKLTNELYAVDERFKKHERKLRKISNESIEKVLKDLSLIDELRDKSMKKEVLKADNLKLDKLPKLIRKKK
jgi:hypothetical protein